MADGKGREDMMANSNFEPLPEQEERRRLAEAMSDLAKVVGIIVENGKELVPGEAVEELRVAWEESEKSMKHLVTNIMTGPPAGEPVPPHITLEKFKEHELTGAVGKLKRSMLFRLRDRFYMFWNSDPRTDNKRKNAGEAAYDYLELGGNVAASIPGYEKVVEFVSLTKQLVGLRLKRES